MVLLLTLYTRETSRTTPKCCEAEETVERILLEWGILQNDQIERNYEGKIWLNLVKLKKKKMFQNFANRNFRN